MSRLARNLSGSSETSSPAHPTCAITSGSSDGTPGTPSTDLVPTVAINGTNGPLKSKHTLAPLPKPGRKRVSDRNTAAKVLANRQAQRNFRERQEVRLQEAMEMTAKAMKDMNDAAMRVKAAKASEQKALKEAQASEQRVSQLEEDNSRLERQIAMLRSRLVFHGLPVPDDAQLSENNMEARRGSAGSALEIAFQTMGSNTEAGLGFARHNMWTGPESPSMSNNAGEPSGVVHENGGFEVGSTEQLPVRHPLKSGYRSEPEASRYPNIDPDLFDMDGRRASA